MLGGWALDRRRSRCSLGLGGEEDLTCANSMYTVLWNKGDKEIPSDRYKLVPHVKGHGSGMHMQIS